VQIHGLLRPVSAAGGAEPAAEPDASPAGRPVSDQHLMIRTGSGEGAEEWSCTQCSRRLLVRRPPGFAKLVLDRGDEAASHASGGGTGLRIGGTELHAGRPPGLPADQRDWLAAHGIDWDAGAGE
jgi:hypothetical protein